MYNGPLEKVFLISPHLEQVFSVTPNLEQGYLILKWLFSAALYFKQQIFLLIWRKYFLPFPFQSGHFLCLLVQNLHCLLLLIWSEHFLTFPFQSGHFLCLLVQNLHCLLLLIWSEHFLTFPILQRGFSVYNILIQNLHCLLLLIWSVRSVEADFGSVPNLEWYVHHVQLHFFCTGYFLVLLTRSNIFCYSSFPEEDF